MTKLSLIGNDATEIPPLSTLRLFFWQIERLDLSNNLMTTINGIDLNASLPRLKVLKVSSCKLNKWEEIRAFREHQCLEVVDVRGNSDLPYINNRLIMLK